MFGYVEPDKPELKMREYDVFRGYYCACVKLLGVVTVRFHDSRSIMI